jgi:predicted DNA-binding protein with PD1-like motif
LLTITTGILAQQTRTKVVSPANPATDFKSNNDTIPATYTINGQFEKILVVRLKHQTDLLVGLDSVVKQQKIRNAVLLSGIGSVRNYHYHVVSNRTFPTQNIFVKDTAAPADLLNLNGYIVDGRVHAHITLSNADDAFGGHLERGTNVFTFAIITIGVFKDGVELTHVDDSTFR